MYTALLDVNTAKLPLSYGLNICPVLHEMLANPREPTQSVYCFLRNYHRHIIKRNTNILFQLFVDTICFCKTTNMHSENISKQIVALAEASSNIQIDGNQKIFRVQRISIYSVHANQKSSACNDQTPKRSVNTMWPRRLAPALTVSSSQAALKITKFNDSGESHNYPKRRSFPSPGKCSVRCIRSPADIEQQQPFVCCTFHIWHSAVCEIVIYYYVL